MGREGVPGWLPSPSQSAITLSGTRTETGANRLDVQCIASIE